MRTFSPFLSAAVAAMASAFSAAEPRYINEKRGDGPRPPTPYRMRALKGRGGRRLNSGLYKGSKQAKKRSRRGGSHAAF